MTICFKPDHFEWKLICSTRNNNNFCLRLVQMALATDFSICSDDWIWNLQHGVCATAICWAFLTKGHQNENKKSPQSMLQSLFKDAEQNSIKTSCLGCPGLKSTAQKAISKIILHRIISAVWLTNFLSEIQSLSNHDDETQFRILSVKPIWSFSAFDHWWSLTAQLWAVMDGE